MSGKPEGRAGPPGLQNVLVYVSGEGFYPSNGSSGSNYTAPSAVKPQQQLPPTNKLTQQQHQQPFYNVQQQQQNGYQYSVASYNGPGVRTNALPVQRRDEFSVMGGDGIGGNVVFPRCSEAESSCSSLSSAGDQSDSGIGSVGVNSVQTYKPQAAVTDTPASVAVPLGWKRLHTNGMVIYVSPSQTPLDSLDQVKAYLQTQGTCKCGLQCPLNCDKVFNFDPKVATRPWSPSSGPVGDLANLCNHKHHKRKQLPMATTAGLDHLILDPLRDGTKKKKRKVVGSYNASVSQLLAQREREKNKQVQQQGWTEGTNQVGRDGSPMMMQHPMQPQQTGQVNRSVYPPAYGSTEQQQFYRYNSHGSCVPQPQAEMMGGGESNYASPTQASGQYQQQQNNLCGSHVNQGMMMNHQYQYPQRVCPEPPGMEHHCQPKQQTPQQMMHQQQQQHFQQQQQQQQQQHFQQNQQMSQHMMTANSPRPQLPHNVHQQMMNLPVQSAGQHYERIMNQSTQIQYQEQKQMQMMQQHQQCVSKPQMQNRDYQRTDVQQHQQQVHQVQQGMVLQSSQGQVMLPQQSMVLQQQQQQQSSIQVTQNQTMIQGSTMVVQNQNQQMQQSQQVMMQQHSTQIQQGVQVQMQNHQQAVNQAQSNPPNNMCTSPATLTHHQRPAPPWQTNRNNQLASQNAVINQQSNQPSPTVQHQQLQQQQSEPPQPIHTQQLQQNQPPQPLHNQQLQQNQPPQPLHNQQMQQNQPHQSLHNQQIQQSQPPQSHHNQQMQQNQPPQSLHNQQMQQNQPSQQQNLHSQQIQQQQQNQLQPMHNQQLQQNQSSQPLHNQMHQQQQNQSLQQIHNQQIQQNQPSQQLQQQQVMPPNMYDRVPPLHHHLPNAPVWNDERKKIVSKMQGKPAAHLKNKRPSYHGEHHHNVGTGNDQPCPNVDVRHITQEQTKSQNNQGQTFPSNNVPSFMEDPSGYLAQQTALLNSTISRQTGMNGNGVNIVCQNTCNNQGNDQSTGQGQVVINLPTSTCSPLGSQGLPLQSNVMLSNQQKQNFVARVNTNQLNSGIKVYKNSSVSSSGYQNQPQNIPQSGVPDSSGGSPDRGRCGQGCGTSIGETFHSQSHNPNQNTITVKFHPEESPVTSSTFMENRQNLQSVTPDNRGPIQGGTVSTSNRSPAEIVSKIPPEVPSPGRTPTPSSTQSRRLDASPESSVFISTSSPFTLTHGNTIIYQQQAQPNPANHRHEVSNPVAQSPKPQQLSLQQQLILQHQHQLQQQQQQQQQHQLQHHQSQQQPPQQQQQQINLVLQDMPMSRIPTIVTTMASGHTVSSNTITSVLAGRANTATVTVNNQTTVAPPTVPPPVVTNQQVSQVSVSKSPLEMVQSVVSSIQVPASSAETVLKPATAPSLPAGHILMSSNGQLIVTNSQGQPAILSPQQNLAKINTSMPPMTAVSTIVTSVTGGVTQVIPTVGVTQQVLGQPTVLVNTLPTPLLFQPGMMTVDGTMNTVQIPHLAVATGNVLPGQVVQDDARVNNNGNGAFSPRNQSALLSPEGSNGKRKGNVKKRKVSPQTVASMLHIAAQQNSPTAGATGMVVQQQQPQQNFSPPMLQALTILPSKTGHFGGTQQLIATGNILQPLNLVQNFPTIQQFIVPAGLGGMVMATGDGTATLLQDTVQLNVLTPMQGPGGTVFGHTSGQSILTAGPAGMVIRTPANTNQQTSKVQIHPQTSAGNQFIAANSPNQFLMNSPAFSGQLSPMLANVSPTNQQIHSFNTNGGNAPNRTNQEFIQCGQTLMVPCSIAQNPPSQNTTVVQQNTTIVQQQTTMVSNNQQNIDQNPGPSTSSSSSLSLNQHNFILNNTDGKQQNFILTTDQKGQGGFILSPNPDKPGTHILLNTDKTQYGGLIISQEKPNQMCGNFILSNSNIQQTEKASNNFIISGGSITDKQTMNRFAKHSVSTQTAANQQVLQVSSTPVPTALVVATSNTFCQTSTAPSSYSGSPPDTTTHSPVDGGTAQSPGLNSEAPTSSVAIGSTDDLASPTSSSDPAGRAQPMVHCVSSSNEQDSLEWKESSATSPAMFSSPPPNNVEITYNRRSTGNVKSVSIGSYVESSSAAMQTYENERLLKRTNEGEIVGRQMYDYSSLARSQKRKHSHTLVDSETRIHTSTLSPHEEDDEDSDASSSSSSGGGTGAAGGPGAGDLVWGPARGYPSWPGKLVGPAPTPGRVWVRWFGGPGTLSEVHPAQLKTLSEGLEAHHRERKKFRKSRKLNSQLENAIQEAMAELDRMSETPQQGAPLPPTPVQVSARKR